MKHSANSKTAFVLEAIADERALQEQLKAAGKFRHTCADAILSDLRRFAILAEEFGEVAREVTEEAELESGFGSRAVAIDRSYLDRLRSELIQVAAVSVAWVENIDRLIAE